MGKEAKKKKMFFTKSPFLKVFKVIENNKKEPYFPFRRLSFKNKTSD